MNEEQAKEVFLNTDKLTYDAGVVFFWRANAQTFLAKFVAIILEVGKRKKFLPTGRSIG